MMYPYVKYSDGTEIVFSNIQWDTMRQKKEE